jgi:hypothetical protein
MLKRVITKAHKHHGTAYPAKATKYLVDVKPGVSVAIFDDSTGTEVAGASFKIGDQAEYDSFNLSYYGTITAISEKTVTITSRKDTRNEKVYRLDMHKFCWRNYNFNLEKAQAENTETSMYI